jgi:hypothetical protein
VANFAPLWDYWNHLDETAQKKLDEKAMADPGPIYERMLRKAVNEEFRQRVRESIRLDYIKGILAGTKTL